MKIRDLAILVKYAQGHVVFDSFIRFVRFISDKERQLYLAQIRTLILGMEPKETDESEAIEISGLPKEGIPCLILSEGGINVHTLEKICQHSESEFESSFKLVLNIFTVRYQRRFNENYDDPGRSWYWDFSNVDNMLRYANSYDATKISIYLILEKITFDGHRDNQGAFR